MGHSRDGMMRSRELMEGTERVGHPPMLGRKNGRFSGVGKFFPHAVVASVGVSAAAFLVLLWVSAIGKTLGNWQPGFLASLATYIAAGIALGYLVNGSFPSRLAIWVWVPVFLWLLVLMGDYASPVVAWREIWTNFFTNRCDSSECLYELLGTLPFFGSVGYSLGAWLRLRRGRAAEAGSRM